MNKKKMMYGAVAIAVVVGAIFWVWHLLSRSVHVTDAKPLIRHVTVAVITPTEVNDYVEASGIVLADTISEIASRIMGTIKTIDVHQGQKVSAGQALLTIDNKDLTERLNAAQASYEEAARYLEMAKENKSLADTTYDRYKKPAEQKAISGQEFDQVENKRKVAGMELERARAQLTHAQSALDEAKVNLGFAVVTAPTDGIVTGKYVDAGSMATPGTVLMSVEDTSKFKIEANIDERLSNSVKINMPVEIWIDSMGSRLDARINEIVPSVDPQARSFMIKSYLLFDPNVPLRSGLYARVLVPAAKRTALIVPPKAIISKGQLTGVYVADEADAVSYRLIRIGKTFGNGVEVLSGLEAGERIVVEGAEQAIDGGILENNKKM